MLDSSPQLTQLTDQMFWDFVHKNSFVLIHFWAAWNGNDLLMRKLLETQIPKDLSKSVALAQFEVDPAEHQELCRQHNVLNVPFLAFYRNGLLFRTVTGMRAAEIVGEHLRDLVHECAA